MTERLYNLLPAVYRLRDGDNGPLRQLMTVMEGPLETLRADIARLYDNWFIETCDEWVVPYIGDLLGVRGQYIFDNTTMSLRPFVANTLRYRRRKGTAAMLEGLALDVTAWPTRVVEFFQLLATTQHLNHIRKPDLRTPDLRDTNSLELLDGPFERTMHFAEVRRISTRQGKYNIGNVGMFVWRLLALPVTVAPAIPAVAIGPGRYRFNQLGADMVLFNRRPDAPAKKAQLAPRVVESDMPGPLRLRALYDELNAARATLAAGESPEFHYFAHDPAIRVFADGVEIPAELIQICDLSEWATLPPSLTFTIPAKAPDPPITKETRVAVDPRLGRLAYVSGAIPRSTLVSYRYGFAAKLGAGNYRRDPDPLPAGPPDPKTFEVAVTDLDALVCDSFAAALLAWNGAGQPNATFVFRGHPAFNYQSSGMFSVDDFTVPAGRTVVLRADDEADIRPILLAKGLWRITLEEGASVTINGFLVTGGTVELATAGAAEALHQAALEHTTIVPGLSLDDTGAPLQPDAVTLATAPGSTGMLALRVASSIVGRIDATAGPITTLSIVDTIVDGAEGAGPAIASANDLRLDHVTVFGRVTTKTLVHASEVIFGDVVTTTRTQTGCVRFSYLPPGSITPMAYRCQPALAIAATKTDADAALVRDRLKPAFTSRRYIDPGYAQLAPDCPVEIATGAEAGKEMGAFQILMQPQRLANLATSLDEYLRFGLEAGVFLVT